MPAQRDPTNDKRFAAYAHKSGPTHGQNRFGLLSYPYYISAKDKPTARISSVRCVFSWAWTLIAGSFQQLTNPDVSQSALVAVGVVSKIMGCPNV